jgi:hypothetical protein
MQHAVTIATALRLPLKRRTNTTMCCIPEPELAAARARLSELSHNTVLEEYQAEPKATTC